MAIGKTNVLHNQTFDLKNGLTGVNDAAREFLHKAWSDKVYDIEGFIARTSAIPQLTNAGRDYSKTGISMNASNVNNPWGSLRFSLQPKTYINKNTQAYKTNSEVKFTNPVFEDVIFRIDNFIKTENYTLHKLDTGTDAWSYSDLESTVNQNVVASMTRTLNYDTHSTIKKGGSIGISFYDGKTPRKAQADFTSAKTFTDQLIEALATYTATPENRFADSWGPEETLMFLTPRARAKLLIDRLTIFDGQFAGTANEFYTGLYDKLNQFAGSPVKISQYMNPTRGQHALDEKVEVEIVTLGRFGNLMFDVPLFEAYVEDIKYSGFKQLTVYGQILYGMSTVPQFNDLITLLTTNTPQEIFTGFDMLNGLISTPNSTTIEVTTDVVGTADVIYKLYKVGEPVPATWSFGVSGNNNTVNFQLAADPAENYIIDIALADTGQLQPKSDTYDNETVLFEIHDYVNTPA